MRKAVVTMIFVENFRKLDRKHSLRFSKKVAKFCRKTSQSAKKMLKLAGYLVVTFGQPYLQGLPLVETKIQLDRQNSRIKRANWLKFRVFKSQPDSNMQPFSFFFVIIV